MTSDAERERLINVACDLDEKLEELEKKLAESEKPLKTEVPDDDR